MEDPQREVERFSTNIFRGHAPGLWVTLHIDLGRDADTVQEKFLSVIGSWLRIAEPVHQRYGFPCRRERFPPPEEIATQLPDWFIKDFAAYTEQEVIDSDWRYLYVSWVWAMEERCWNWWGYERHSGSLIVQLQVDGWPCPTEELAYVARAAGAESIRANN